MLAAQRFIFAPRLTKFRIWLAMTVAVGVDVLQLALGPLGWVWVDQGLDVFAMVLTTAALGFHYLLLPTFIIEFIPVVDALPTWTGCVGIVIFVRKRLEASRSAPPQPPNNESEKPPVEISATVTPIPPKL